MSQKKIEAEILSLENLQQIVQTYEEIAASRMQRSKTSVLKSRDYLAGLGDVFHKVQYFYRKELEKREEEQKGTDKELLVLLSANTGLYGDIVRRTFNMFIQSINYSKKFGGKKSDVVVVGKLGRQMFEDAKTNMPDVADVEYTYFELSDGSVDSAKMKELVEFVVKYDVVSVFHGKFDNLLVQIPLRTPLTGDSLSDKAYAKEEEPHIFEPSLDDLVTFFESQILASLFEQTVYESNLSKFASRMTSLDRAVVNITEGLKKAKFMRQVEAHKIQNKKQLGALASMSLWNGGM